jgi:putative transposase
MNKIKKQKYDSVIDIIFKLVNEKYYSNVHPGKKLIVNLIDVIEGIIMFNRSSVSWDDFTYKNIKGHTIKYHFNKWTKGGIFDESWRLILNKYQKLPQNKYKSNLKNINIDASYIKSINGKDKIGRNPTDRGRNASKLSTISDIRGVPIGYILVEGNQVDIKLTHSTIQNLLIRKKTKQKLYADKGYASPSLKTELENENIKLVCPNKKNFKNKIFKESNIGKKRYVAESCFSWTKSYRRIRNRYEALAVYFEGFIKLTYALIISTKIFNLMT